MSNQDFNPDSDGFVVVVDSGPTDDQGTVVVFAGITDEGENITFGVDHTTAQEMVDALGLNPTKTWPREDADDSPFLFVFVEDWQVLSRSPADDVVTPVTDTPVEAVDAERSEVYPMSRKDYEAFAAAIKALRDDIPVASHDTGILAVIDTHAQVVASIFKADNAAFDKARFLKACGVSS